MFVLVLTTGRALKSARATAEPRLGNPKTLRVRRALGSTRQRLGATVALRRFSPTAYCTPTR